MTEIELLKSASYEIKQLRSQNSLMAARLDMFDKCLLLLTTTPNVANRGMSEDVAWEIDKFINSQVPAPSVINGTK